MVRLVKVRSEQGVLCSAAAALAQEAGSDVFETVGDSFPSNLKCVHKKSDGEQASARRANDDPFLNPLFDYRILLKLDPKRPAPHLNLMKAVWLTGGF